MFFDIYGAGLAQAFVRGAALAKLFAAWRLPAAWGRTGNSSGSGLSRSRARAPAAHVMGESA